MVDVFEDLTPGGVRYADLPGAIICRPSGARANKEGKLTQRREDAKGAKKLKSRTGEQ
jgi:hypothetical protein